MNYINPTPNPSGSYPAPQSTPAPGLLPLTDEQAAMVIQYNGFVILTIEDVAEQVGGNPTDLVVVKKITAVEPNTEAWEAWKAAEAAKPPVEQPPTPEERMAALEEENQQLKEKNKLLTAQMSAQSEQMDFHEDCIAEMASIVYA